MKDAYIRKAKDSAQEEVEKIPQRGKPKVSQSSFLFEN